MIIKATTGTAARSTTAYFNSDHIISFQPTGVNSLIVSPINTHVKLVNGEQFYCRETAEELYALLNKGK